MLGYYVVVIALCLFIHVAGFSLDKEEPICLSRFDHDYKVLQKLVMLEQQQAELRETITKQHDVISDIKLNLAKTEGAQHKLEATMSKLQSATSLDVTGSTYVRWGRTSCPGNGSELVYEGYAAGSHYTDKGAAANYLCLPTDPLWGHFDETSQRGATVYGAEYEFHYRDQEAFFGSKLYQEDVPCAVCKTTRASGVMIPGRNACYPGWTLEYSGYLTGGHTTHHASEFVCMDGRPEWIAGGHADHNGILFYMAEVRCGSLKCPPYVEGRELTCAMCTK